MKILIADDDAEIAQMLSVFLRANEFEVVTAADAMQALLFAKQKIDAIILDVHLPGGSGLDTLKRLKRAPQTKHLPVIVISGDPAEALPLEAVANGASDFLPKPLDLDRLLVSLKSSLQLTELGRTGMESTPAVEAAGVAAQRILIAEDDKFHRLILEKFLPDWGFQLEIATDGNTAVEMLLAEDSPRLALLDWMLPGLDGPGICRKVRAATGRPYTYLILLTAKSHKQDLVQGLESGADDYLVKPFDAQELRARLRVGSRILQLQKDLLVTQERLHHEASHDALTLISNRRSILQRLDEELARSRRESRPTAVILVDVDNFKQLNDTLGHQAGDVALREVASRLKKTLRSYDVVGRYGGEEFLVLAQNCGEQDALVLGERLRESVAGVPIDLAGAKLYVTISVGVATCGNDGLVPTPDLLLSRADEALYSAKNRGRNRVQLFQSHAAESRVAS